MQVINVYYCQFLFIINFSRTKAKPNAHAKEIKGGYKFIKKNRLTVDCMDELKVAIMKQTICKEIAVCHFCFNLKLSNHDSGLRPVTTST